VIFYTLGLPNNIINVGMINSVVDDDLDWSLFPSYIGCLSDRVKLTFAQFLHPLPEEKTTVNGGAARIQNVTRYGVLRSFNNDRLTAI